MKTTLELPDELMRAVRVHAAVTDRKLKDVLAEAIARGLESLSTRLPSKPPAAAAGTVTVASTGEIPAAASVNEPPAEYGTAISREALDAIFAAGDEMARQGVDFAAWAKTSRDVWR